MIQGTWISQKKYFSDWKPEIILDIINYERWNEMFYNTIKQVFHF